MVTTLLYAAGVAVFLVALFCSIALHELGHLGLARRFGCRVSEYMIGFGPTLLKREVGETTYGVKLVPVGGYVKIIGMFPPGTPEEERIAEGLGPRKVWGATSPEEPAALSAAEIAPRRSLRERLASFGTKARAIEFALVEPGDRDRLFYKLPARKKIAVMAAGPAMNLLIAFVCFQGVYAIHGTVSTEPTGSTVVASITECVIPEQDPRTTCTASDPASPAAEAGLQAGDEITSFNGQAVSSWDQLSSYVRANGAGGMQLTVQRDGEEITLTPTVTVEMQRDVSSLSPETAGGEPVYESVGFLGARPEQRTVVTRHGPLYTLTQMGHMTTKAASMIVQMPVKVWNVATSIVGFEHRDQDGPMSVIGGSRVAGEVASSQIPGFDTGSKAAMLGVVVGSFNLFIGIFNLIPLLPFDGGHIAGALWERLRRAIAAKRSRPDPGPVDVTVQVPVSYAIAMVMVAASAVLMIGDLVVPLTTGF